MLTKEILQALKSYAESMQKNVTFVVQTGEHSKREELVTFLSDIASVSEKLNVEERDTNGELRSAISFLLEADGEDTGIRFSGIPGGHEFNSLVLAMLHAAGTELKLAADGEILVRHPGVFKGYYKNEEATKEVIDEDGWLYTGDVGEYDGEFLKIVDRKKDIIITSGGKNVSPSEIENNIKTSPFIKEAIVIGDDRKFLSALIGIEYDIVSNWALRKNIAHTTYRNLSENEEVQNLIWDEIQKANEYTSSLQIRKFRMLTKELDHEDGDLTATQKAKRNVIMEKFSDLIEDMYK